MSDQSTAGDILAALEAAEAEAVKSTASTAVLMSTSSDDSRAGQPPSSAEMSANTMGVPFVPTSEETIIEWETTQYLSSIEGQDVSLSDIRDQLLIHFSRAFSKEQVGRNADKKLNGADHPKLTKPKTLDELTCARVLLSRYHIRAISLADGRAGAELTLLGIYTDEGEDEGLYLTHEAPLIRLAYQLKPSLTANAAESLMKTLKATAPVISKTLDAHLIPVANGIFNRESRELMPFDPQYVFLAKSPVSYRSDPENPVIVQPDGVPWDVESWIRELSDDEGVPELLWEIISATLRPGERFNQAAFLHSTKGNNGKGTYCELLRALVGADGHASIPIAKFGEQFALAELVHARAIIVDENPVGAFSKDLGDFKAVITGDTFTLERKYKNPLSVSFSGMVVQCVNDFPKSRDKSASYTRRQLFVPFKKWFGGSGVERKYIKEDYLHRPEVLEYVLHKGLNMDHAEFSNPAACQELLAEFQRANNPVMDFWLEMEEEFAWDLLPTNFLYDLFVAWFQKNNRSGTVIGRNEFTGQLGSVLEENPNWDFSDTQKKHRPAQKMTAPELLIAEYDLKDWMNASYAGTDPQRKSMFSTPRANYRGVVRVGAKSALVTGAPSDAEGEAK